MSKFLSKSKRKAQPLSSVPQIVIDCIEVLEERGLIVEGILRVSGSNLKMRELRKDYEKGKQISLHEIEIHTIGGLLKNFFRETKDPIIPFCYYETLLDVVQMPPEIQIGYIKSIITNLPDGNQETLHLLTVFLNHVAHHSEENKMDLANLATMFGPNLIRNQKQSATQLLGDLPSVRLVMLVILRNYKYIFENWPDDQIKKPPRKSNPFAIELTENNDNYKNNNNKNIKNNNNNNNSNNNINEKCIENDFDLKNDNIVIKEKKRDRKKKSRTRKADRGKLISSSSVDIIKSSYETEDLSLRNTMSGDPVDFRKFQLGKDEKNLKKRSSSEFEYVSDREEKKINEDVICIVKKRRGTMTDRNSIKHEERVNAIYSPPKQPKSKYTLASDNNLFFIPVLAEENFTSHISSSGETNKTPITADKENSNRDEY